MREYILEMNNISKSFGGIKALDNVSIKLRRGEVLCLCGENGAGKSTLMKILAGAETPSGGEIIIDGQKVQLSKPIDAFNYGISMVYQELIQIEQMSIAENIYVGRYPKTGVAISQKKMLADAKKLLNRVGLNLDPNTLVKNYSIAQRQLIEIAKALSHELSIIVFDEPTAALTLEETENLYKIIRQLKEKNIAIILISHRFEDVFAVCDRVITLRDGKNSGEMMVKETTVDEIISHMIGRQITQQFPTKTNKIGDVILRAKNFKNERLHDVSLELHQGEVLGIGGLVGAGRTEMLRAIFGADAYEGVLELDGVPVNNASPTESIKKGFALLPEDRKGQGLVLEQSILQNIGMTVLDKMSKAGVIPSKVEKDLCDEYIRKLSIKAFNRSTLAGMLSGGNQQKVVLGKCLAPRPRILLLDEPTRGVDVGAKAEIYKIINNLATEGISIIVVSSEMQELLGICDRIIVLHEGHYSGELSREEANEESIMRLAVSHTGLGG